jgi:hypothetical protein
MGDVDSFSTTQHAFSYGEVKDVFAATTVFYSPIER